MSIEETHEWAKKMWDEFEVKAQQDPNVGALSKELSKGGDHPIQTINFVRTDRSSFAGEVGQVEDDLFFHFFPVADSPCCVPEDPPLAYDTVIWTFTDKFKQALADSFLAVFKQEDKLCWDYVPEMRSWVVRCKGFGANIMKNALAEKLFDTLQTNLE